jgi:RimJ/RimL family protein N-acetyltransferase
MPEDAGYCGGAYTEEGWRGRSIHAGVHAMMLRHLQENGFRRAYTWAHLDNRSSRATIERMGWTRTGVMLAFTPAGNAHPRVWCVRGRLEPFAYNNECASRHE